MNECLVKEKNRLEQKELELKEMVQNRLKLIKEQNLEEQVKAEPVAQILAVDA
jgi:hypothetical protein